MYFCTFPCPLPLPPTILYAAPPEPFILLLPTKSGWNHFASRDPLSAHPSGNEGITACVRHTRGGLRDSPVRAARSEIHESPLEGIGDFAEGGRPGRARLIFSCIDRVSSACRVIRVSQVIILTDLLVNESVFEPNIPVNWS